MIQKHPVRFAIFGVLAALAIVTIFLQPGKHSDLENATIGALKPITQWSDDLVLTSNEVPAGWTLGGGANDGQFGVGVRYFWFPYAASADKPWLNIGQFFGIYSSTVTATETYNNWLDKYFPPEAAAQWRAVPELSFAHHADQFKLACLTLTINAIPFRACKAIARYQNLVVMVNGNVFEDQWLTVDGFRNTLIAADRRIAVVLSR